MLVLKVPTKRKLFITNTQTGEVITVSVNRVLGNNVSIGIDAPKSNYHILRDNIKPNSLKTASE
jgi:sRNA-binding carbon storage regulator CsrA